MAVSATQVTVGAAATALNTAGTAGATLVLQTDVAVDLGDSSVTSGAGFALDPTDGPLVVALDAGDVLYAVSGSSSVVQVLST